MKDLSIDGLLDNGMIGSNIMKLLCFGQGVGV